MADYLSSEFYKGWYNTLKTVLTTDQLEVILGLREKMLELREENIELREQVAELSKKSKQHQLLNFDAEVGVFFDEASSAYCPRCRQGTDQLDVVMSKDSEVYRCSVCSHVATHTPYTGRY